MTLKCKISTFRIENHQIYQTRNHKNISRISKKFYIDKMVEKNQKFTYDKDSSDKLSDLYGIAPFKQSQVDPNKRYEKVFLQISELNESLKDKSILLKARLQNSRVKGKSGFLVFRQGFYNVQGVMFAGEKISPQFIKFAAAIPIESIVEVEGIVKITKNPIESCTQKNIELEITKLYCVVDSISMLPFQLEDANRKGNPEEEEEVQQTQEITASAETPTNTEKAATEKVATEKGATEKGAPEKGQKKKKEKKNKEEKKEEEKKDQGKEKKQIIVKLNTRLDNRVLDLRTNSTQAMMRLQSGVGQLFREYLYGKNFIEIHTPKLIAGTSEGGTNVFKLKYFDQEACLAQSPQLYKQMAVIGDLPRVFEVGPVFRAENSNTGRHLCEFTGLDIEMVFNEHYFEVLDVIGDMFYYIFEGIHTRFAFELNVIANQYPYEKLKFSKDILKIDFREGVKMLESIGVKQSVNEDLSTDTEKALGKLVAEKYGTDFYILYRYPHSARPFYTMPDPLDPNYTNSYDAFIRGEEVLSGAQRVHDYDLLYKRVVDFKINPKTLEDYINAFKLGAPPHGGCGIGLERVVKLIAGIGNIKKCCMFPRDPKRLTP
jgi:aspartyl-tRNA synthetase